MEICPPRNQASASACGAALLASLLLALTTSGAAAQAQPAGAVSAVNPASTAGFGGIQRTLHLGGSVVRNEHVRTTADGSLQITFIDKTTLNIGPNSDVTIDEFVYDAGGNSAKMAVTMTRGLLRVVGGQATHTNNMTILTPVATVGVRGGIATVSHDPARGTKATDLFGVMTVKGRKAVGRAS